MAIVAFAGSFIDTIIFAAPVVWLFFLATGVSVFVLRRKEPGAARPYRVTGYPVTTIVFCASCAFMLHSSISFAWEHKRRGLVVVLAVLAAGGVAYLLTRRFATKEKPPAV